MCTLGAISGRYLFKNRDLWPGCSQAEEIMQGRGRYRYQGVRGQANSLERGLNSGINEAGVAVAITYVDRVPLAEALSVRSPRGVLVEEILRSCRDLSSALRLVTDFLTTPLAGGNIVILSPEGGAVLEQLYPLFAIELIKAPVTVRTNHFCNLRVSGALLGNLQSSTARFEQMTGLLSQGAWPEAGAESGTVITLIKEALANHDGRYPICSHGGELRTVSSALYDLKERALHYTGGHPCETLWETYRL
jgi:hypothetical protein